MVNKMPTMVWVFMKSAAHLATILFTTIIHAVELKNIIGHRGFAGLRPENTLAAFSFAAEFGLSMIEFDVQLTKDQEWVVFHDTTLERITNSQGKVSEYTLAELTQMDAGSWFDEQYKDQKIPSLAETLDLTDKLNLDCNIEIKGSSDDPERYANLFAEFIRQHLKPAADLPLVSSFNVECLIKLRRIFPTLPIAIIVDELKNDTLEIAAEYGFSRIHADVNQITIEDLELVLAQEIPIYLYTVNDKQTADAWFEKGVTGFFSDHADLLI